MAGTFREHSDRSDGNDFSVGDADADADTDTDADVGGVALREVIAGFKSIAMSVPRSIVGTFSDGILANAIAVGVGVVAASDCPSLRVARRTISMGVASACMAATPAPYHEITYAGKCS